MAGLQFNFTGNNKTLLKNIAQVQNALTAMSNELESNGENFTKFFNEAAKGGVDLTKALAGDEKEMKKLAASMKTSLKEMQAAWDNLTDEMKSSGLGLVFQDTMKQAQTMSDEVVEGLLNSGKAANKASGDYNGIAVQMQMLAREVPNLANSFSIFMMAIGNNLPMLADELSKAKKEVDELKKAGKEFTPVWKQAFTALFNWQTLLLVAITALTAYGDEIVNFVKDIFNMNKALKSTAEMQEAINESLKNNTGSYGEQVVELKKLQSGWAALGKDLSKQKQFIIENKDAFEKLGVSVTSVADAENLLITNTDAFIASLDKKAQAEASYKLATEKYEEAAKIRRKAAQQKLEGASFGDKAEAFLFTVGSSSGTKEQATNRIFQERLDGMEEEAKKAEEEAKAYLGLGDAKKKEAEDALKNAQIKEAENKALEEEKKRLQELQQAKDAYLQKQKDYEQALKEARTKGAKAATDAEKEGYQKQLKQMEDAHKAEMNALDKEKADLLKKKTEVAEAKAKSEGKVFKAADVQLSTEEEEIFANRRKDTETKQKAEIKAFYDTLAKMQEAATLANASQLEQQLFDIDTYYQEQISKAEGFEELKTQLTKNWAAERAKAENEARLRENQQAENKALMTTDNTYLGTGLTEKAEKEKTQILIDYAKERIAILKALGDEQSQAEAETLAKQVEAYNKQLKQPMSVKGWFDSKIFDKLEKKYLELGETQEEAKNKASGFFAGLQNGASKTIDAVGLLQTAFGGLDENLDKALNAIGSVANGFASGGLVGGIAAATGVIMQSLKSLGAADYSQYQKMVEEYDSLLEVWDTLIDKKTEYINISWGDEARKAAEEAEELAKRQISAYEELGKARLNAGAGWGSHSIGIRQKDAMSQSGWDELKKAAREIGFSYEKVKEGRMTGLFDLTAQQLEDLQAKAPTFWAQLDEEARGYLENIIACQDEIETMKDQLNEATTGVSFDSFYDNFVSTLTDMNSDSQDFADDFGNYLKDAIMRNIVANKYKGQIESLYQSWANLSDSDKNGAFDLTSEETAELQAAQKALADAMIAERDALADTFGWLSGDSYKQEASKGAFTAMSQETGNELNGRFTAFQISNEAISANTKQIAETINLVLSYMPKFDGVLSDVLSGQSITNDHLATIERYTKEIKSFGDILRSIADNTKNL